MLTAWAWHCRAPPVAAWVAGDNGRNVPVYSAGATNYNALYVGLPLDQLPP